jgi:TP53 regulating kinase-like protein
MDYIDGPRLKEAFRSMNQSELKRYGVLVGTMIARLHSKGIVHGDLTTSNMILREEGKVFFIDYGLSDYSSELEARGVDMLLMSRAFKSTHYALYSKAFPAVVEGYASVAGRNETDLVLKKMHEIESRGRYSERTQTRLVPDSKQGEV